MAGGWTGRILRLDLEKRSFEIEDLDEGRAASFLGGRGLAAACLREEADPTLDPFDPLTPLIFATGPLTGTNASCGARYMVVTKGPLTDCITTSNAGGHWGPELKYAGYDMLIVKGKAASPVYVYIENDSVEFRPASHLWGKGVWDTEDSIKHELASSEVKIASIGPAGENLVRFAAVMNDKHRAAGRSGVGAVMGAKNLKAIAVRGTSQVRVDDPVAFMKASWEKKASLKASSLRQMFTTIGTSMTIGPVNGVGALPTRNFQETVFEGTDKITGELINDTYVVANKACFACTIACGRVAKISTEAGDRFALRTSPRNWRQAGEGPEYESMYGFGPDVGVDDPEVLIAGHWLCNDYGMDPISCGATIAAAMELYQEGLIDESHAGGPMEWGDGQRVIELIEDTALRRGIGDELAEGSKRMTAKYGRPELAMVSKGQEFAAYDGRSLKGRGLSYATSNRGACHLKAETLRDDFRNTDIEGKGRLVAHSENEVSSLDSTGLCLFLTSGAKKENFIAELNAATGLELEDDDYVLAGERIWNTERLFNLAAGITPADDTLPKRMLEEPIPSGPRKGMVSELKEMLEEYYVARDWPGGVPSTSKLADLGLSSDARNT